MPLSLKNRAQSNRRGSTVARWGWTDQLEEWKLGLATISGRRCVVSEGDNVSGLGRQQLFPQRQTTLKGYSLHRWRLNYGLPLFVRRFCSQLETKLFAKNNVSGAVDGRGGHASLSEVAAAPGVRRDAEGGDYVSGRGEPAGKVGQAALFPKIDDWSWITMQHGSTPPGGQLEDSGGWTGGGGGWCVELKLKVEGGSPLPCSSNFHCIPRPRPKT